MNNGKPDWYVRKVAPNGSCYGDKLDRRNLTGTVGAEVLRLADEGGSGERDINVDGHQFRIFYPLNVAA